ncbi:hypothetical protein [Mycobacterium sp. E1386]|uniref:hypothetical protein n=1 Tax=Mycobacterium sp. E1386 TaxID=1834126 RepID=UPI000A4BF759|nr:hypothetical protein [Mycobacterium sp. E1386]
MPALDPRDRLQRFVLRARKVIAHSLVREHPGLLRAAAQGNITLQVQWNRKTGEGKHRLQMTLPPEEQFESFAARIRPFTTGKEPVYWSAVLDALEKLLSKETLEELVDIEGLRTYWRERVEGSTVAHAYYAMTENGTITDVKLADMWLNSDALHTQLIQSAIGKDMSLTERYKAAAGVYTRIGVCVEDTLWLISYLVGEGLLDIDKSVFNDAIFADTEIDFELFGAYCAPVGSEPMPTDMADLADLTNPAALDTSKWTPIHLDPELMGIVQGRAKAAEDETPKAS